MCVRVCVYVRVCVCVCVCKGCVPLLRGGGGAWPAPSHQTARTCTCGVQGRRQRIVSGKPTKKKTQTKKINDHNHIHTKQKKQRPVGVLVTVNGDVRKGAFEHLAGGRLGVPHTPSTPPGLVVLVQGAGWVRRRESHSRVHEFEEGPAKSCSSHGRVLLVRQDTWKPLGDVLFHVRQANGIEVGCKNTKQTDYIPSARNPTHDTHSGRRWTDRGRQ